jgi:hypothetical protein
MCKKTTYPLERFERKESRGGRRSPSISQESALWRSTFQGGKIKDRDREFISPYNPGVSQVRTHELFTFF